MEVNASRRHTTAGRDQQILALRRNKACIRKKLRADVAEIDAEIARLQSSQRPLFHSCVK
jgi:hypothetical protein